MFLRIRSSKWLLVVLIAMLTAFIPIFITVYELITTDKESVIFLENYNPIISNLIISYYILLFALSIGWLVKQLKSIIQLKSQQSKTELMHLQSQVNPHFFFNMLNNLYGLVDKDSKKAQDLILKLSDLMRYSIYEGKKELVLLEDEVGYLKQYIELHKMRYHKKIDVIFKSSIQEDYKVIPLMFIILLENAFKHGVENLRKDAYVHASMIAESDEVHFEVENNFDPEAIEESGIGLENLKRRLELVYPKKHTLTYEVIENIYKAKLILKLG